MSARIPAKYADDYLERPPSSSPSGTRSNLSSARSGFADAKPPTPPPFNLVLQTSTALPSSQFALVAAAAGKSLYVFVSFAAYVCACRLRCSCFGKISQSSRFESECPAIP